MKKFKICNFIGGCHFFARHNIRLTPSNRIVHSNILAIGFLLNGNFEFYMLSIFIQ